MNEEGSVAGRQSLDIRVFCGGNFGGDESFGDTILLLDSRNQGRIAPTLADSSQGAERDDRLKSSEMPPEHPDPRNRVKPSRANSSKDLRQWSGLGSSAWVSWA
jgi:hypothetical protein